MKKFITCILIVTMFAMPFYGLTETYLPKEVKITIEQSVPNDNKVMVILDENREFVTIKNMNDRKNYLSTYCYSYGTHIRGIKNDGTIICGARGLAQLAVYDNTYYGMTPADIIIVVHEEDYDLVKAIVFERTGAEEVTNASIMAATIWFENSRGGHIVYDETTQRAYVADAYIVNQNLYFEIWAGDIDLNNNFEMGFIPGGGFVSVPETKPTPEPELEHEDNPNPNPNSEINVDVNVHNTDVNIDVSTTTTTTKTEVEVTTNTSGCVTNNTTVNNGSNNTTLNTSTKVNGDGNTTTTNNNTVNTFTLFGVTINQNTNTNIVTTNKDGTQEITQPTILKDYVRKSGTCS